MVKADKKGTGAKPSGAGDDSGSYSIESTGPIDPPDEGDAHDSEQGQYLPESAEPAPWLLFGELIFRDGLNLTVRHGPKWLGFKGDVQLGTSEDGPVMGIAEVVDTLYVPRFEDLKDNGLLLKFEHDPKCRSFFGLVKVMQACYPGDHVTNIKGFTREGPATLVFFVPRILSDGVARDTQVIMPDLQEVAESAGARVHSRTMEGRIMLAADVR